MPTLNEQVHLTTPHAGAIKHRLGRVSQEQLIAIVTVILVVIAASTLPNFRTGGNIISLVNNVSIVGIAALGGGLVIIARGLDISQVASMVLGPALALSMTHAGFASPVALLAGLGATLLLGFANGVIVAFVEMPALFATLATNLLMYGVVALFLTQSQIVVYVPQSLAGLLIAGKKVGVFPVPVLIFIGAAIIVHMFLSGTRLGRFIYAHGDNPIAAREIGIPVRSLTILEYCISSTLAYIAGVALMGVIATVNTQVITGSMIFDIILIAVVGGISLFGGRGSVISVVVGALLIGVVLNIMTLLNFNNDLQNIVRGLVLLVAIVIDNRLHPRDEETARQGE